MTRSLNIQRAAVCLLEGGVVAYPTEGVYGIGCIPDFRESVQRVLDIKERKISAGLILVAPDYELLAPWINPGKSEIANIRTGLSHPVTWIVTAAQAAPEILTGGRATLAIRISGHPVIRDLCSATGSALVSTSANRSGHRAAKSALQARKWLGNALDYVISAPLGNASGPSEIRSAYDGHVIRPLMTTKPG